MGGSPLDCGHADFCNSCLRRLKSCPLCRMRLGRQEESSFKTRPRMSQQSYGIFASSTILSLWQMIFIGSTLHHLHADPGTTTSRELPPSLGFVTLFVATILILLTV